MDFYVSLALIGASEQSWTVPFELMSVRVSFLEHWVGDELVMGLLYVE